MSQGCTLQLACEIGRTPGQPLAACWAPLPSTQAMLLCMVPPAWLVKSVDLASTSQRSSPQLDHHAGSGQQHKPYMHGAVHCPLAGRATWRHRTAWHAADLAWNLQAALHPSWLLWHCWQTSTHLHKVHCSCPRPLLPRWLLRRGLCCTAAAGALSGAGAHRRLEWPAPSCCCCLRCWQALCRPRCERLCPRHRWHCSLRMPGTPSASGCSCLSCGQTSAGVTTTPIVACHC